MEILSPCAAACLYRRDFLLKTGGFDARFFAYLEDVDLDCAAGCWDTGISICRRPRCCTKAMVQACPTAVTSR
jgi:hypothetical protein